MYTIILSVFIALLVSVGGILLGWWGWFWGIFLGLIAFAAVWVVAMRRIARQLAPTMAQVKRQAEARQFVLAIQSLDDLMPLSRWVPMLRGQLVAQKGALRHYSNDSDKALAELEQAPKRLADAQMLRASILYQKGAHDRAIQVLDGAAPYARKSDMLHNLRAWMLQKQKRTDDAIERLAPFATKRGNETTKDNLLRLQNGRKVSMKPFGMAWYALGLERPPAQPAPGQQNIGRKGFRQPPKRRRG